MYRYTIAIGILAMLSTGCSQKAAYSVAQQAGCQREQEQSIHPQAESCANQNYEKDYERYQREREKVVSP